ncbi:MAG: hypothetical protein ACREUZ_21090, partial [Burkholderiales bacterium]
SFRARVLARIEEPRRRVVVWGWLGAAAAVAITGIAASINWGPTPPHPQPRRVIERHVASRPVPPRDAGRHDRAPESATERRGTARRGRTSRAVPAQMAVANARPVEPAADGLTVDVAPMNTIAPIAVAPLDRPGIAPTALAVAALRPIGELPMEQLFTATRQD